MQDAERMAAMMKRFISARDKLETARNKAMEAEQQFQWAFLDLKECARQMDNTYTQMRGVFAEDPVVK